MPQTKVQTLDANGWCAMGEAAVMERMNMSENKLYIGNLSFNTTDETLTSAFAEFGTVGRATVVTDRDTGRSRGFGFVEMSNDAEAKAAIGALDGQMFDGRTIQVNVARPREGGGGGGRGNGGGNRY